VSEGARAPVAPSFSLQVQLLTQRMLDELLAAPAAIIGGFTLGIGMVLVADGLLGESRLAAAAGGDYLAFVLPAGVLSAAAASRAAGYMVFNDAEDRYLDRLLTMPLSRAALVLAPMLIGAMLATVQGIVVLGGGALLGATPETGLPGAAGIVLIAVLWAMGITGYMVVAALVSRNIQVILTVELLFLPLLFLSPVVTPREDLRGWAQLLADLNPTTYALEGMRALMLDGWESSRIVPALGAAAAFACVTLGAAALAARRATERR
jgi:ABC-2 type transport system permease protein